MGTQLLARQDVISDSDYLDNPQRLPHEILGTTRPDLLEEIHAEYLAAGADVLETDTFQGTPRRLAEYGLEDRAYELDHNGYVQAKAFVDGGADVIIIETQIDLIETKAIIFGCTRAFEETGKRIPIQCQVTLDTSGRMLFGTDIAAALTTLESLAIDVIGLNCSTGPDYMREPLRYLCENSRLPVSCIPNAGLPINVDGQPHYPMGPEEMGKDLIAFVRDLGANIIGGCCGTTTDHVKHFRALLGERPVPN